MIKQIRMVAAVLWAAMLLLIGGFIYATRWDCCSEVFYLRLVQFFASGQVQQTPWAVWHLIQTKKQKQTAQRNVSLRCLFFCDFFDIMIVTNPFFM